MSLQGLQLGGHALYDLYMSVCISHRGDGEVHEKGDGALRGIY